LPLSNNTRRHLYQDATKLTILSSIDGVLLRSSTPIPAAREALSFLQQQRIPFILLTNGGGKSEEERVAEVSDKLQIPMDKSMFVQSHTPFAEMTDLHDKTILVAGGDGDKCATVARGYGFKHVVTPADIVTAHPEIWPFAKVFADYYASFANPLPAPIDTANKAASLRIDAMFVYNDPRDWGLDATLILDLLLSERGILGTLSPHNANPALPNNGYLQDSQPHLYFSNPDLWWAASYHLPRLGQGGFREAFAGLWASTTGNASLSTHQTIMGKPHQPTYEFAERLLRKHRKTLFESEGVGVRGLNDPLRRVYMVGDNPESDIRGANGYRSPYGSVWRSCLVGTGVYAGGGELAEGARPDVVCGDVGEAVRWALGDAGWRGKGV